ncbi:MAG: alpha/beta hydrolase [Erysipelotrichaceae bacterium]|jgi:pimeloyl-ACP methyl ester carboxylesterase|nr:alpha/beta hydrolase [Erysipelotrichaceae bacterium]
MLFTCSDSPKAKTRGMLLHGMFLDASSFDELTKLLGEDFGLLLVTFDGHHQKDYQPFVSLKKEVVQIEEYLLEQGIDELDFIVGTSLGALAAFQLFQRKKIPVKHYFLDGGPFFQYRPFRIFLQECVFQTAGWAIRKGILNHPGWVFGMAKKRLSLTFVQSVARGGSCLTKSDIHHICHSIFNIEIQEPFQPKADQLIFIYGEREMAYQSFARFRQYEGLKLIVKKGYGHCGFIAKDPQPYAEIIHSFIEQKPK